MSMSIGGYNYDIDPIRSNPERRVNNAFNNYCTEAGVSCLIGMNPGTYNRFYTLKNVGKKLVRVEYDLRVIFLEPGEHITLEVANSNFGEVILPRVEALNNGL